MLEERFTEKYEIDANGCWVWTAATNGGGYGAYADTRNWKEGKNCMVPAHRYAYESEIGPIPSGMDLDHLCRVRRCVNPEHVEPVSRKENLARGVGGSGKTHCKHGHEFTVDNTYRYTTKAGNQQRFCRKCMVRRSAETAARKKIN